MTAILGQPDILGLEAGAAGTQELAEAGAPVKVLPRVKLPRGLARLILHTSSMQYPVYIILITPVVRPLVVGRTVVWASARCLGILVLCCLVEKALGTRPPNEEKLRL